VNHTHFLFPIYRIIYLFLIDVITTLRTVRLKEGIPGWYQGNGVHMIRVFPYAAVQFLAYEYFKKVMKVFNWIIPGKKTLQYYYIIYVYLPFSKIRGTRGQDRMVVAFTTTYRL
jgi:hypothetical protein